MTSPTLQELKVASAKVDYARKRLRLGREEAEEARRKAEEEAEGRGDGGGAWEPTLKGLAARMGISRQTFHALVKLPDAPKRRGNKGYRVAEWGQWLLKRKQVSEVEGKERSARVRYLTAQAEAREMANAERAGRMMERKRHEEEMREFAKAVGDAVGAMRQRAAMRGADAAVVRVVEETAAELRHEILRRCGDGAEDA